MIDEGDFNALGYKLLKAKNTEGALYVFEKNAALHPTSGNAWDSLGEAQAGAGRLAQAIESYRKARRAQSLQLERPRQAEGTREEEITPGVICCMKRS